MKKSNLRDKRYTSLHLFSRLFVPSYKKPVIPCNWDVVEKSIMRRKSVVVEFKGGDGSVYKEIPVQLELKF